MEFQDDNNEQAADADNIEDMLDDLGLGEDNTQQQASRKDSTIFIIDCCPQITVPFEGEDKSQLDLIFQGYSNFLQRKIIASSGDKVGLIFYNVKNKNNSLQFDGICTYHNLQDPTAQTIKQANNLSKQFNNISGGYSKQKISLHQVFWLYNNQIKEFSDSKYYLRLFLFTADDCPHNNGDEARDQTINHAKQLSAKNVQIQLFPIRKQRKCIFDIRKFYQQIVSFDPDQINSTVLDSSSKILDLKERLRQKQFKKRTLNRLLMKIGNQTQIGVKLYALYTKAKKPVPKKLDGKTNRVLQRVTKKINQNGQVLFDGQIDTYYPLGGQKIKISKQDMNKIKNLQPPGMTLIGFKPKKCIKPYYNLRTSYFLYPDEQHVSGSSQFCSSLIDQLIKQGLIGIVKIVPRNNQQMSFAALFPQQQKYDEVEHFQTPPGFNMIILPYADDIVNFVGEKTVSRPEPISQQLVSATKLLINSLTIQDFDFRDFQNPSIQKFYSHLQALALGQKTVQQRRDLLQPDKEGLQKFGDIVELVMQTVKADSQFFAKKQEHIQDEDYYKREQSQIQMQKKSKRAVGGKGKKIKKQEEEIQEQRQKAKTNGKNSKQAIHIDEDQMQIQKNSLVQSVESLLVTGEIDQLKVSDLRQYLKHHKLQTKGKKQDLITRALVFISQRTCI